MIMPIKIGLLILFAETWNTAGQIFLKKATNQLEAPALRNLKSYLSFLAKTLQLPGIWLGLASLTIGIILWLMALAQGELSAVYPIGSLQYILTLIAARIFLHEKIDGMKLAGTLCVILGIILIVKS